MQLRIFQLVYDNNVLDLMVQDNIVPNSWIEYAKSFNDHSQELLLMNGKLPWYKIFLRVNSK